MVLSASSSHKHLIRQQQQQQQQQNPVKFIFLKSENQSKPPGKDVNSSGSTSTSNMPLVGFNTRSNTIANIERTNNTTAFNSASFESQPKEMMQKWVNIDLINGLLCNLSNNLSTNFFSTVFSKRFSHEITP